MFNVGSGELLVILLVALLVLGPKQIPGMARQIGRGVKILSRFSNSINREIQSMSEDAIEEQARERGQSTKDSTP